MKLTNEQKADNAIKWMNVMTYGKNPQGECALGDKDIGYCCLGLGHVRVLPNVEYSPYAGTSEPFANAVGLNEAGGDTVIHKGTSEEKVDEFRQYFKDVHGGYISNSRLTRLNDVHGLTFKEISKVLRKFPEFYFTPVVAKLIKQKLKKN